MVMSPQRTETRILLIATVVVVALALVGGGLFFAALRWHPAARPPPEEPISVARAAAQAADGAAAPMPDYVGPECSGPVVTQVRSHPSPIEGLSVDGHVRQRLAEEEAERGQKARIIGWRGREDREKRGWCRISVRYQFGPDRGASMWLVDPEREFPLGLEPQDALSMEVTKALPLADETAQAALQRKCASQGIREVKGSFSYMENHNIWSCLRKRASEEQREQGTVIQWGGWRGEAEGDDRCVVSVAYRENGRHQKAFWRLRYLPDGEKAVEPLTPRAIEAIYGPGVRSR